METSINSEPLNYLAERLERGLGKRVILKQAAGQVQNFKEMKWSYLSA
jgi:hypothetical protein